MSETNEKKIAMRAIIEAEIFKLVPILLEAEKAKEMFNNAPSVRNGARRYDAEVEANHAIERGATRIVEKWSQAYRDCVEMQEVKEGIHETIASYFPKDGGEYWLGQVGRKLEGNHDEHLD